MRADDNLCTQTVYATPTGSNERVLAAPASRTTTSCATPTVPLVTYSKDTWEYDTSPAGAKLPPGKVSNGFVTAHTVSRLNLDTGAPLGDIRVFDATYDPATGQPSTITQTRDDGARQKQIWDYDPFGLAPVRVRTEAINANGTRLTLLQTVITRDPITLNALTTTDPNGTQSGNTFDGFNRVLLSTVTPPGGTSGALSLISYLGFAVGQPGGRRIVQKVFTDPVAPASVGTAAGRTGTVFLDKLGRDVRTEVALGADYANQTVVTGDRSYDTLGRVRFEADPHLSTDASLYGTTYHIAFDADGRITLFNRAAERVFRCPATAAIGTPCAERLSPDLWRLVSEYVARAPPAPIRIPEGPSNAACGRQRLSDRRPAYPLRPSPAAPPLPCS